MIKILITDDERSVGLALSDFLTKQGERSVFFSQGVEGPLNILAEQNIDIAFIDFNPPNLNGITLLKEIKKLKPELPVILMTSSIEEEGRDGFKGKTSGYYLEKPLVMREAINVLEQALQARKHANREDQKGTPNQAGIIGTSAEFKKALNEVYQVAPSHANVLIQGESGTGRDTMAKLIHELSGKRDRPFVKINFSSLPDSLLEQDLFGTDRRGEVKWAVSGGILFLDKIETASANLIQKMLQFVRGRGREYINKEDGSTGNARIIVSITQFPENKTHDKLYEDFLRELNPVSIYLPSLVDRTEDIVPLAKFFIKKYAEANSKIVSTLSSAAALTLERYPWKDNNIAELESVMQKATIVCSGVTLDIPFLPEYILKHEMSSKDITLPVGSTLEKIEKVAIEKTLEYTKNNKDRAAEILGIGIATLYRKLKVN